MFAARPGGSISAARRSGAGGASGGARERHGLCSGAAPRAGVDSPFEPLLRLWQLGVVFEELHRDVIVLDRACARVFIRTWRAHMR